MLFKDAKFLILLLDTIISIVLYFVGKYAGAGLFDDIQFLIYALQPVFLAVIAAIAAQETILARAEIRAAALRHASK